ncbi:MAG: hypothetical protein IT454_07090 [Planctomycetes bacterium]|nr:hypothetical protein [Planctomycetota bacterium]
MNHHRVVRLIPLRSALCSRGAALAALTLLAPSAAAQITYSIDWKSESVSKPSSSAGAQPITEGDALSPPPGAPAFGPLSRPALRVSGNFFGLQNYASCVGHAPGTACEIEVDALSSGHDTRYLPGQTGLGGAGSPARRRLWFSVDEWAAGSVATPQSPAHPNVFNQGNPLVPPGSSGVFEACADVFVDTNLPSGPIPPSFTPRNNAGAIDGNGLASANGFVYLGLGLIEPRPTNTPFPHPGDNLDALEIGTDIASAGLAYISLDSGFFDPLNGVLNSGSAANNGFVGGDVLKVGVGVPLSLYAPAALLGLDKTAPDQDDLDALILADNGDGIYIPSLTPYDWNLGVTDMLIFSVRRGSAIVNQPDSIFGAPIQPGDLLIPPVAGGLNTNPGIFISAEALGLRTFRGITGAHGDDVDAIDVTDRPCFDCNENGVEDAVDIANGSSLDANSNGVPDECEDGVVEFCGCAAGSSQSCANVYASGGCANSTGVGAKLLTNINSGGSISVTNDDLVLSATQLPPSVSGLFFMGPASKPPSTFNDGLRCIDAPTLRYALQNSGLAGTMTLGPGLAALSAARFGPNGAIDPGETWYFQCWYRDGAGPCNQDSNVTNAVKVTFGP